MSPTKGCNHPQSFEVVQVLDAHVTWTDAILMCGQCEQFYLAEMIDLEDGVRAYRLSTLASEETLATLRSLTKGSCDLHRAGQEIAHLASLGEVQKHVLLITNAHCQSLIVPDLKIPQLNWRELACDGSWLRSMTTGKP